MRTFIVHAASLAALMLVSLIASADPPTTAPSVVVPPLSGKLGRPIQLFDGKSLDGWVWVQKPPKKGTSAAPLTIDDVFSVHGGVLHSAGKPIGYIRTERSFTHYVLTVEERHLAKGNGGLLVGITGPDPVWPGIEIQTMTGNAGDLWNHNHLKMTTDPARTNKTRVLKIGLDSQKPVGEWDTMEVTVDHGNLVYRVNGVVQNVATDTESLAGKVGIQVEGAEMEFRKVQITPIEDGAANEPPATQPTAATGTNWCGNGYGDPIELFNGENLDGWKWVQRPPKPGSDEKPVPIDAVWSVRDGILHDTGKPVGYIHTEKSYDNYLLIVEQRHVNKGNGGVLFAMSGPDKVWPHCLECQGQIGEEGDLRNVGEFKMDLDRDRLESPRRLKRYGPDPEKPIGQWEEVKIVVDRDGRSLLVFINGNLQNIATETEDLAGMIGLQAEGGEMEFRKIELLSLSRAESAEVPPPPGRK